jgi:hypothetical protein
VHTKLGYATKTVARRRYTPATNQLGTCHLHAAYMVGLTDERTRTKLRRDREIRALCARIEDMESDSQLAADGLYVRPRILLLKDRDD